ncbi:phosphohistidine phosphatase SixA [Zooshikella ganghwensis]|uniref:Phosphohistidine phosphatase SixA n=1 Tax=Zooshikella ganghwensis TaxID=202772 RepID=A0A4P9VQZ2_9GAMM|nr:phosphohistidine phosphatase SixA [Zooshikella ganghwensis]RDH44470.1 phosphohistidine phosphatase SixA [Zooshikella ganghwensis]
MKIMIMRHGEAEATALSDGQRPLTEEGINEVTQVAELVAEEYVVSKIIASPLLRAQQTASLMATGLNLPAVDTLTELAPEHKPESVLKALASEEAEVLLLVSHMPLVDQLAGWLLEGSRMSPIAFPTATVAVLHTDHLAAGVAELERVFLAPS